MAKKKIRPMTTDRLLSLARDCEQDNCTGRCPFYGKENCKNKMLKKLINRLFDYYSVVGELDGKND